jgi:hypothetical protein
MEPGWRGLAHIRGHERARTAAARVPEGPFEVIPGRITRHRASSSYDVNRKGKRCSCETTTTHRQMDSSPSCSYLLGTVITTTYFPYALWIMGHWLFPPSLSCPYHKYFEKTNTNARTECVCGLRRAIGLVLNACDANDPSYVHIYIYAASLSALSPFGVLVKNSRPSVIIAVLLLHSAAPLVLILLNW